MAATLALWIFLSIQGVFLQDYDYDYEKQEPLNCSVTETIRGGHVTYSQGGLQGSGMTYHCGAGRYPYPVSSRVCGEDGNWSPMRSPTGRPVSQATCKEVLCPAQLQLDSGDFWPRDQWFRIGTTQSFSCQDGFTLHGSAQRNCTSSGEWTGKTPICDDHSGDCDDPGIPPGAERLGGRIRLGEKVTYWCHTGLNLLGSTERVCLKNREWSGSPPRCQGTHGFDSPSSVAEAMAGSLAGLMDVLSPDFKKKRARPNFGRAFRVAEVSRMHVYILMDSSGSIKEKEFNMSRDANIALIEKLSSYDVQLNFHVVSFASDTKVIVDITEADVSGDTDEVIAALMEFDYKSHGQKRGTNLYSALYDISKKISFFKENMGAKYLNETQNIIIIETDGYSNTGMNPQNALTQIRHLLGYSKRGSDDTQEKMLDLYIFGIGQQVNKEELNKLVSKKSGETHFFVLQSVEDMKTAFNDIISDKSVTMCGIAQEIQEKGSEIHISPWHINLIIPGESCSGTILGPSWLLTAAHCFNSVNLSSSVTLLSIKHGGGEINFKRVILHPEYNIRKLKDRNVPEFYDYDVALIQLADNISLSWQARPICLPCTTAAARALKKVNSTCEQHRTELLGHSEILAYFKTKKEPHKRKQTHIHLGPQRQSCVEKASLVLKNTSVTVEEYVTERFLCSGGLERHQNEWSCKGDSGGSLFVQKKSRFFQVGVLSWGNIDLCDLAQITQSTHAKEDGRDFHIDVFELMPWLREHLGKDVQFLP